MGQSSRPSPSRYSSLVLACLGGLVATICPARSLADIYQSVGPDGVVSFTNTKAPGAKLYQKGPRPQVFLPADTSPERYTRYDNWIREAAGHPSVTGAVEAGWTEFKAALRRDCAVPDSRLREWMSGALVNLGYAPTDAARAVAEAARDLGEGASEAQLIRNALKALAPAN